MSKKKKKNLTVIQLIRGTEIREHLKKSGIKHELYLTSSTTTIYVPALHTKYIISDSFLTKKQLGFIMRVKSHVNKTHHKIKNYDVSDIDYFKFAPMEERVYYDVDELDVNGAYWEIAHQLKYIDDKIYGEGLEVDKKTRLIALGALATNKRRFDYVPNEGRYKWVYDDKDEKLRSFFFHVAKRLDVLMGEYFDLCGGDGIYFYWVDAMFISKSRARGMIEFFEDKGLALKRNRIASLRVEKKERFTKVTAVQKIKELPYWTDIKIKPYLNINKREYELKMMEDFNDYLLKRVAMRNHFSNKRKRKQTRKKTSK